VTARHLELGGEALLWTLERDLGPALTPEARQAWGAVYDLLIATMLDGMCQSDELSAA
jgi:nitric oxide dioxygenase